MSLPLTPPNIVFILADDLGYGDLGCFGNPIVRTPHLDRLANEGVALTQHYAASPLCAPSRAGLLTGRYNHRTGAVDVPSNRGLDRIDTREQTFADAFGACGYATGMVGKWHNGLHDLRFHPNARGFSEFTGFLNGGMDYYRWVLDRNGRSEPADGRYLTDVFTDEAVAFVQRHRREPFLLYVAYNAPHDPLQAPDALVRRYRESGDALTDEVCTLYAMIEQMDAGIGRILDALAKNGLADNTIVLFTSDNGPYLNGARQRYNGPFRGAKGDALEGGIRVPGIVRWPDGLPAGTQSHFMTHFCDWFPTLLSLAGQERCRGEAGQVARPTAGGNEASSGVGRAISPAIPQDRMGLLPLDGYDMSCRLRGEAGDVPDIRFWQRNRYEPVPRCNGAMRDGPWKLVWPMQPGGDDKEPDDTVPYRTGLTTGHRIMPIDATLPSRSVEPGTVPQLFNVETDPFEERNIASEHPERVATMTGAWDRWFEEMKAEWWPAYRRNVT